MIKTGKLLRFILCIFVCPWPCKYMYTYIGECAHICIHRIQKRTLMPSSFVLLLSLEAGSVYEPEALVLSAKLEASKPQKCMLWSILQRHLACYMGPEIWILVLTVSKQMPLSTEPSFQSLKLTISMTWKTSLIVKFLFHYSWSPLSSCPACPFCLHATCYMLLFSSLFWRKISCT